MPNTLTKDHLRQLRNRIEIIPLIADVHFSPARAIEAIEAGAAKIRLNPGNIKKRADIIRIIDAAKMVNAATQVSHRLASVAARRSMPKM